MTGDTLILGVGNPIYGDDAIGIRAVELLRERSDLPPGVDVVDGGTDGLGLIPLMEAYRRVIIVDAVPMGRPAGTIRRFRWQDARFLAHGSVLSLHQSDLTDALMLADTLKCLPQDIVIFGVQPHNMGWDQPLSPAVEGALITVIRALIDEVKTDGQNTDH